MKPFDIELAKAGHPVCTRNGRKARILCYDRDNRQLRCIVALVTEPNGLEEIYTYTLKGRISRNEESNHDLVMAPERKTGWINLISAEDGPHVYCTNIYPTEMEAIADVFDNKNYITTIQINWEE